MMISRNKVTENLILLLGVKGAFREPIETKALPLFQNLKDPNATCIAESH
jgi:hypothetical protein